jgi:hypothetical protein
MVCPTWFCVIVIDIEFLIDLYGCDCMKTTTAEYPASIASGVALMTNNQSLRTDTFKVVIS